MSELSATSEPFIPETVVTPETGSCLAAKNIGAMACSVVTELYHKAYHDQLTGLPNEDKAKEQIETYLEAGIPIAVLQIDLTNFGEVNRRLGHTQGDGALVAVTAAIKDTLREKPQDTETEKDSEKEIEELLHEKAEDLRGTFRIKPGGGDMLAVLEPDEAEEYRLHGDELLLVIPLTKRIEAGDEEVQFVAPKDREAVVRHLMQRVILSVDSQQHVDKYNQAFNYENPLGVRIKHVIVDPSTDENVTYTDIVQASETKGYNLDENTPVFFPLPPHAK